MIDRIKKFYHAHLNDEELYLTTVSGVASTKKQMVRYFDKSVKAIDLITTKSFQVTPNPGNREPVICQLNKDDFGNSVGLRNPGLDVALKEIKELREEGIDTLLNISVSASRVEDFITLINAFDPYADSIELNFSCPHASAGFGSSIGCDINIASSYVKEIRKQCPNQESALIIKLTPNVENIGEIAAAVVSSGADGLAAINTVGPVVHKTEDGNVILNNKLGGKGGMSGAWVKDRAIECVKEIRQAVGEDVIIYAMGGMYTPSDLAAMHAAGADTIGLGSVFGKVKQQDWPHFTSWVKDSALALINGKQYEVIPFFKEYNQMEYTAHKVVEISEHSKDMLIITLDGKLNCISGQFAFLWIPGLGEKPFSVAHNEPLTFLIRKRGYFTTALFDLKVGDTVYTRGLYGKALDVVPGKNNILLAGGSGAAVLPSVCRLLTNDANIETYVGTSAKSIGIDGKPLFYDYLSSYGKYTVIEDDGKPGRVLDYIQDVKEDTKAFIIGPEIFSSFAAKKFLTLGLKPEDIYISLERNTLCGIGVCGECVAGDRLTCQWGTFMTYDYLYKNAKELIK